MIYNKKSQVNILDLIVAMSIALMLIVAILISWDRFVLILGKKTAQNDLQIVAFQLSDILISNTGTPENWSSGSVSSLGLAIEDRRLTKDKLQNFSAISYNDIKSLLKIQNFDFNLNLSYLNESQVFFVGADDISAKSLVRIRRLVWYNGTTTQLKISLWK
ncbi:hypothetical protein HYX18_02615 [Candidatus Woesearchaeota archaeon]|nr:hypothetical protein [Candidatus Woesearchaeota archaeon]